MSSIYLSLGSNLNDRFANLRRAVDGLQKFITITAISPVFATEPWVRLSNHRFLTFAAGGTIAPTIFWSVSKIEQEMGREPSRRLGHPIDIDILFYDKLVIDDENLTIPIPHR